MRIGIATDSSADLPKELIDAYGIEVVPLEIICGNERFCDEGGSKQGEFYHRMETERIIVSTSQPPLGCFMETYRRMLQSFDKVISIHLAGTLSGTVQGARVAGANVSSSDIYVVDSESASMGLGSLVLLAARWVKQGLPVAKILQRLEEYKQRIKVFVTVDTLDYLESGGRIGKMAVLLGSLLKVKPIICLKGGVVEMVAKVRGRRESVQTLLDEGREHIIGSDKRIISVMHTAAEAEAGYLFSALRRSDPKAEMYLREAGLSLGSHTGPKALGIAVLPAEY